MTRVIRFASSYSTDGAAGGTGGSLELVLSSENDGSVEGPTVISSSAMNEGMKTLQRCISTFLCAVD